jgi:hypothetical protein
MMLKNFSMVSFGLIFLATVLFLHWILYGGISSRMLETLPVSRSVQAMGLMLPGLLLELLIIVLLFWPILLVLTGPLGNGIRLMSLPLHLLLMTAAGVWALVFQYVLRRGVRMLSMRSGLASERAWHSAMLTAGLMLIGALAFFFPSDAAVWFPPSLFARTLLQGDPLAATGLAVWALIGGWILRHLVLREDPPDEPYTHWRPLARLPFSRRPVMAFASLELKQWSRDMETHLYTGLFLLLLLLGGQAIRLAEDPFRAMLGIVFSSVVFYGLPYFLSVYPLRSHHRTHDAGIWMPVEPHVKITGKMLVYLTLGPLLTAVTADLLIRLAGLTSFGADGWLRLLAYTALIHATAFFAGTAFPVRQKSATGLLMLHLVFLVMSVPLFLLTNSLWDPEAPAWSLAVSCALVTFFWFASATIETRRETS